LLPRSAPPRYCYTLLLLGYSPHTGHAPVSWQTRLASMVTIGRATADRLTGPARNAMVLPLNVLPRALIVDAMILWW